MACFQQGLQDSFLLHGWNRSQWIILVVNSLGESNSALTLLVWPRDVEHDELVIGNKLIYQHPHIKDLMDNLDNVYVKPTWGRTTQ